VFSLAVFDAEQRTIEVVMLELDSMEIPGARIKVVGVGGGGGNALNTMIQNGIDFVDFVVINTDQQDLDKSLAGVKIRIGDTLTRGLGAGANPDRGRQAALDDYDHIVEAIQGADMVFVAAGMGGGTGTGAAPVAARAAREMGALTVGVVTRPFKFEGRRRAQLADKGINELREVVDTLIVIPNDRLRLVNEGKLTLEDGFAVVDGVLSSAVEGIAKLIKQGGYINVDFADVETVMKDQGMALMGTGRASGEGRCLAAVEEAISSPLLEDASIDGARGVLIHFAGSQIGLEEINDACELIYDAADPDALIIFGAVENPELGDAVEVTIIATGFDMPATDTLSQGAVGRVDLAERDRLARRVSGHAQPAHVEVQSQPTYHAPAQPVHHHAPVPTPRRSGVVESSVMPPRHPRSEMQNYEYRPVGQTAPVREKGISNVFAGLDGPPSFIRQTGRYGSDE
jgi:cell division protein FtsZ